MATSRPEVRSVVLQPNPVNINKTILIAVTVEDAIIIMHKVNRIAGAARCGETISLVTRREVVS